MNLLISNLISNNTLFAQAMQDIDIIADISNAWTNFVESGQVWAMLIGLVLGYIFASFTRF